MYALMFLSNAGREGDFSFGALKNVRLMSSCLISEMLDGFHGARSLRFSFGPKSRCVTPATKSGATSGFYVTQTQRKLKAGD